MDITTWTTQPLGLSDLLYWVQRRLLLYDSYFVQRFGKEESCKPELLRAFFRQFHCLFTFLQQVPYTAVLVRVEGDLLQTGAAHFKSSRARVTKRDRARPDGSGWASYLLSELAVEPYGFKTPPVLKVCYLHLQLWTRGRRGSIQTQCFCGWQKPMSDIYIYTPISRAGRY